MNTITIAHLSDIYYAPSEISEISTMLKDKGVLVEKYLLDTPRCSPIFGFPGVSSPGKSKGDG